MELEVKNFILDKWLEYHSYDSFYGTFPRFRGAFIYNYDSRPVVKVNMRMGDQEGRHHLKINYQHLFTDDYMFEGHNPANATYNYFVYDISDFVPPYLVKELEKLER